MTHTIALALGRRRPRTPRLHGRTEATRASLRAASTVCALRTCSTRHSAAQLRRTRPAAHPPLRCTPGAYLRKIAVELTRAIATVSAPSHDDAHAHARGGSALALTRGAVCAVCCTARCAQSPCVRHGFCA